MYRFVTCIWDFDDREAASQVAAITRQLRSSTSDWRTVMDTPGMIVLCTGADGPTWQTYLLASDGGAVLGMLFRPASNGVSQACPPSFDEHESRAIVRSGGNHLVRHYWGRYVAFLRDSLTRRQYVLRDPTALFPCYAARLQSVDVYFSWLADATQVGISSTRIDVDYVRAKLQTWLAYGQRTGLTDVSQVLGGECVAHTRGNTTRSLLWNPLQQCEPPIEDKEHAAAELRRVTRDVVQAWAERYSSILHSLSGGVDSSIVLACLQDVSAKVTCLTAFTSGAGDERALARLCAQKTDRELLEQHRVAADLKLDSHSLAPLCPEPIDYIGSWLEHIQHDAPAAHEHGAGAIFTGMGGDEVFGRTGPTWAIRDFVRRHGLRPALFRKAMDAAALAQLSVWDVLHQALSKERWDSHAEFGAFALLDAPSTPRDNLEVHPALRDTPSHVPCGKRRHAYLLTPPPPGFADPVTAPVVERVMPLRSQPLLELCLRVPTYTLIDDGWDRALARRAFCSDLPAEILSRRTKGEITEYALDVIVGNLSFISDLLLHGQLVREGLIDRKHLISLLSMERARHPGLVVQIQDFVSIEMWLRSCLSTDTSHPTEEASATAVQLCDLGPK